VDTPAAVPLGLGGGECDRGGLLVRDILANTLSSTPELEAVAPAVMETFNLVNPRLGECDTPPADIADSTPAEDIQALETVTGTDMTEIVGVPIADALLVEPDARVAVDSRSTDTGVATAVGGVVIEETVVEERAVTAPEQVEVVGPQTAATGGLPATGNDGSMLTMLGLAMIASGAAARFVARD
jgi:LPXTG-motif cell wall-anchored protein